MTGGSGSEKTKVLLNLIKNKRPDIDKVYSYAKDLFESKHQLLKNGRDKVVVKKIKKTKELMDYSQTIDHVYKNSKVHNPTWVFILFDGKIADMEINKNKYL